jgi:sulfatase modifying factor 1
MMNSFGSRQSALKKDVETGKWGAAVAAVAATLRERVSAAVAAQDRADWATALAALTADRPQEPFPDAFAAEPLLGLLQQLAALEKDIRAGQRAAAVEAHLSTARAAAAKQDWPEVMAAADKALALDDSDTEAKALRAEVSRHHLRVPEGFRLAPGAGPEPYTNTGWARAIIHEKSGIELVYIPAGSFTMGSPQGEEGRDGDEGPQHQVTLSQGFYLGKTEVTQAQWEKVTGKNPSDFQNAGPTAPVENVSWDDCQAFCKEAGSGLRLPLEAEWEYACRAGTTTAFHYGDSLDASMANFDGDYPYGEGKKGEYRETTIAVGQFKPNAWGLYDMHGNVWEWCQDWIGDYPAGAVRDPRGPDSGADRVLRGGGWYNFARYCRSASRNGRRPDYRIRNFGLRVARSAPPVQ